MGDPRDITAVLESWPIQAGGVTARRIVGVDGAEQIQLRIPMGLLQMYPDGKPDGQRPGGFTTTLAWVKSLVQQGIEQLEEDHWTELDREVMQFYHRRVALLAIAEAERKAGNPEQAATDYARVVRDADHNLEIMDFIKRYNHHADYVEAHEQYRPFVLGHRTLGAGLYWLCRGEPYESIDVMQAGLAQLKRIYECRGEAAVLRRDPTANRLKRLAEQIRKEHSIVKTPHEELAEAVAAEDFERAAILRDRIRARAEQLKSPFKTL